jgi:hypothetical protein
MCSVALFGFLSLQHFLVIPKKPLAQLRHATAEDEAMLGHLLVVAHKVALKQGLEPGFRVVINDGKQGCQSVYHVRRCKTARPGHGSTCSMFSQQSSVCCYSVAPAPSARARWTPAHLASRLNERFAVTRMFVSRACWRSAATREGKLKEICDDLRFQLALPVHHCDLCMCVQASR